MRKSTSKSIDDKFSFCKKKHVFVNVENCSSCVSRGFADHIVCVNFNTIPVSKDDIENE